ncbi:MAG: RAMP superfamily CRISPR-associated protein [Pseudanabaena sp.]|jgi:CRISPR-associated protein Csx10
MSKGNKQKHGKGSKPSKDKASQPKNTPSTQAVKTSNMQVPTDFMLNISMLSDWHVGTGAGRVGDIDRLVQRDHNGLPYIPAKTLTGIWRDGCELIATGLDEGNVNGIWSQWVNYLFGNQPALETEAVEFTPIEATLSVRSAHFPQSFVSAIGSKKLLLEAITFVKPGISIDPKNGCAKEDFLRFEEMVRAGAVLNSTCQLRLDNLDEQQKQAAFALLIAGTKLIERLGGKRRRGAGKCQWQIDKQNSNTWIDWLEKNLEVSAPPKTQKQENISWSDSITNSSTWVKVELTVTTLSPLIISKRTIGNVVETLDYIPGTHLMRLIIRKLKHLNFDFGSAIAHNKLVVTNATPEIAGTIGKPTPIALFGEKLGGGLSNLKEGGKVYNRLREKEPDMQLKGERGSYVSFSNGQIDYRKIDTGLETHNTIKDELQRPTSDIGGVYSYETIPIGTSFKAELRLPQDLAEQLKKHDANWWQKLKSDDKHYERLGQSKKDDYGLVKIEAKSPQNATNKPVVNNNLLTVWVLSDILLRDERLRPTASVKTLQEELEAKLDVKLTLRKDDNLLSLMARQNRLESWQVRWGLPRPSLVGLAAGSCFVFEITANTNPQQLEKKLAELETTGIGERVAEGFGQLCFNHSLLSQNTFISQPSKQSQTTNYSSGNNQNSSSTLNNSQDPNFIYARYIEKATWRKEIERRALSLAASADDRRKILGITSDKPTMSQLGALRSLVGGLIQTETANQTNGVMGWLSHLRNTPNRREKWTDASLREIQNLVTNQQIVWDHLNINIADITMTQNSQQQLQRELWAEAVQTLVDAIIRAHKRSEEEN